MSEAAAANASHDDMSHRIYHDFSWRISSSLRHTLALADKKRLGATVCDRDGNVEVMTTRLVPVVTCVVQF